MSDLKIPLQETSLDTWRSKYQLKDPSEKPLEISPEEAKDRVANTLAAQEKRQYRAAWRKKFRDVLEVAIPAGRINSNAGAAHVKTKVSLINCVVSGTITDSMDGILTRLKESGLSLKAGCGIGYEFSTLRPDGASVAGAGASTSGPLSFMNIYNAMCKTVSSAGGRRGAQMATFSVSHPDVLKFIRVKEEDLLDNFNLSVLVTDKFMETLARDGMWEFEFAGKPYGKSVKAVEIWEAIMRSTYDFAEPGVLFIDRINKFNNLWFCENLRATNPCGEQPLPPYGSCLLGSMWLPAFVRHPFQHNASFDFDAFYAQARIFTRMLDNVVPIAGLPLPQQMLEINSKRRHGTGIIGLGSAMAMLNMFYGDSASIQLTDRIMRVLALASYAEGATLSKEKGEAPILKKVFTESQVQKSVARNDNWKLHAKLKGGSYTGRELFLMSHYFDKWQDDDEAKDVLKSMSKWGCRFTHATSIAPTGTISLSYGNNSSSGIEPSFSHYYTRNVLREGRMTKEAVPVYSYEYLAYKHLVETGRLKHTNSAQVRAQLVQKGLPEDTLDPSSIADKFSVADSVTPEQHVRIQAIAQPWVDSSISKTVNVPTNISFDAFKGIYLDGYASGLKGCTTFRFNPARFQGVLVREEDLKNTKYKFTMDDGSTTELSGDSYVEYEGETTTAANLYDALKNKVGS